MKDRKQAKRGKKLRQMAVLAIALITAAGTLSGCRGLGLTAAEMLGFSAGGELREISEALGADVTEGNVVESEDSHGGFHGDGMTFVVLHFDEGGLADQLEGLAGWHPLPLSENTEALAYGRDTEDGRRGPYLCDDEGQPVFPEIQNGYYYFCDRHTESKDVYDDGDVFERSSYNFTMAIYDIDTDRMYYVEFDT